MKYVLKMLKRIEDPRQPWKVKHQLSDILAISIIAVMCGAKSSWDIREFAACREKWLKRFLSLKNGIPSRLTVERVLRILDPRKFQPIFAQIMQGIQEVSQGAVVAIDGKKYFNETKEDGKLQSLYMVSAWCAQNGLTLGHVQTKEKSNELTAIPELLELLDIQGATVTIDAIGCQKEIAKLLIQKKKVNYVLSLKDNQPTLKGEMARYAVDCLSDTSLADLYTHFHTVDKGHGRLEKRDYFLFHDLSWFQDLKKWPGLASLILVKSTRIVGQAEPTSEEHYYISSLCDVQQAARAIRAHWGIENKLHWVLDVVFREDHWKTRKQTAAANLATIRKLTLSFLRKDTSSDLSAPQKMWRCALDLDFLSHVLFRPNFLS